MRFIKSFSMTFSSTILLTIFGIFNNIIITRQIGVVDRGKYSVIMNFIMIIALVLGEGIKRSNTIIVGQNKNYLTNLTSKTLTISFLFLVLLWLVFNLTNFFDFFLVNISNNLILIAIISIGLYIFWQSLQALFLGLQEIKLFNLLLISTISITLIINAIGITFFNFRLNEIMLSYLFASFITSILGFFYVKNIGQKIVSHKKVSLNQIINLGGKSTLSGLSSFVIVRGGIFFSNFYLDPKQTGLYSIALLFFEIIQKIPNTLGTLVLSRTANDSAKTDSKNIAKLIRIMFLVNFIFVILLVFLGKLVIVLLFGKAFNNSYSIILYMLPAFFLIGPSSVIHGFYMGKGYPQKIIILNVICGLLTLGLLFIFTEEYGINFVASVSSIIITIWTIVLILFFKIDTKFKGSEILFPSKQDFMYLLNEIKTLFKRMK